MGNVSSQLSKLLLLYCRDLIMPEQDFLMQIVLAGLSGKKNNLTHAYKRKLKNNVNISKKIPGVNVPHFT